MLGLKNVCKEEKFETVVKHNKDLEKQLNERIKATQNVSSLYQERIS